jgi:predicted transposase YbfD/YdcC
VSDWEKDHGRIERRRLSRVDLDWEISTFPGARQLVKVTREWIEITSKKPKSEEPKSEELRSETRYFITSLEREERSAARLGQAIRGHWSVENKNHWKRDTCLWKEDASRPRKKASGGQVLALLRGAVLRLHDTEAFTSLNASFHHHTAKPYAALRLLKTPPPKIN